MNTEDEVKEIEHMIAYARCLPYPANVILGAEISKSSAEVFRRAYANKPDKSRQHTSKGFYNEPVIVGSEQGFTYK